MMFALVAEVPMPSSPLNIFLRLASVRSYIAQFYPDYEYDKTSIEINTAGEIFSANIHVDKIAFF
jgi:hypothetical protein